MTNMDTWIARFGKCKQKFVEVHEQPKISSASLEALNKMQFMFHYASKLTKANEICETYEETPSGTPKTFLLPQNI